MRDPDGRDASDLIKDVEPEDLIKYGLIPEFVGRVPVLATVSDLDEDALVRVLTEPKNGLIKQYEALFAMENTRLTFSEEALKAIAHKALKRNTGARGLRAIMEDILLDPMFQLPNQDSVEEVVVSPDTVHGTSPPLYIHAKKTGDLESSA